MKKDATKLPTFKYVIKVLSPLIIIALISHCSVFVCNNFKIPQEVRARFPVWLLYNSADSEQNNDLSAPEEGTITSQQSESYELMGQKTSKQQQFAWSGELQDWTLDRDHDNFRSMHESIHHDVCIWPEDCNNNKLPGLKSEDRIVDQMRLFAHKSFKKIFKIMPPKRSYYPVGDELFISEACPVRSCSITYNNEEADALIFENSDVVDEPPKHKRINQIWIAYLLESPCHTFDKRFARLYRGKHEFNWTASYRADSDLVTPYSKFVPFKDKVDEFKSLSALQSIVRDTSIRATRYDSSLSAQHRSLIRGKKSKVVWFASNCNAANNRLEYARELAKHIQVDIYGKCGTLTCDKWNQTGCAEMINKHYKFYLSFENSNCRQYITEKFYRNALGYNDLNHLILPVVMGAPKEDYLRFAPPGSFIHVDDFESPKELANHLNLLDSDDVLYYSYFHWKTLGRFIDTKFMCRVCALLHESHESPRRTSYKDIKHWWTTCDKASVSCCST